MSWQAISVESALAEDVAAQLLGLASDPATWTLENLGATVIRLADGRENRFYFSPRAAALFEPVIAPRGAGPCDPPLSRQLVPSRTSRLLLGFKSRWEAFVPPRRVSVPQGVPAARRGHDEG